MKRNARSVNSRRSGRRRGAILVLAALLLILFMAVLAFAIDLGYVVLVRTQLQAAADSAAMAAAESMALTRGEMETSANQFAAYNTAGGRPVQLRAADIEYGTWDTTRRSFTSSPQAGNAVRVTTRTDRNTGGESTMFFGRVFGRFTFAQQASAVAMCNPRDIVFVVDLSGSMNDDTDPDYTDSLNSQYAAAGYPTVGTDLMQQVFNNFGFGAYPGTSEWIGKPLGVAKSNALSALSSKTGPLSTSTIPAQYRIKSGDSTATRKQKAYSWAMDVQIRALMPAAKPVPNSTSNYNYWATYLDSYNGDISYRTYTGFMMYYGRDSKPDGVNYTPLSRNSPLCPMHTESTAGGNFSFPPCEQPTHAARRSIIAALQVVKERNQGISDQTQRDWVSIVTFDSLTNGAVVLQPLTGDCDAAMRAATGLQACNDNGASTATEVGLISGANLIKKRSEGGTGREATNKVVVLLTDGRPNLYSSSNSTINSYVSGHPSANFYSSGNTAQQAALMQTSMVAGNKWQLYPVGIGLGCDYDFMDRMARMGTTAKDGQSPRGSGNPIEYEQRLTDIFNDIITNPRVRLVQ